MKISEIMTRNVQTLTPDSSLREAASLMGRIDSGALLVNDGDRLVGMVTDRDITVRGVAAGLDAEAPVREVNGIPRSQRYLVGWFGIRGIGSLYYLCFALAHAPQALDQDRLGDLVLSVVALSILLHGLSIQPLLKRFHPDP